MATQNTAAWIPSAKANIELTSVPVYEPGPHELLIKNKSLAFNPIEWKIQKLGIFVDKYPTILGWSFAGTVEKVGAEVKGFNVGDRVVAARKMVNPNPGLQHGAMQQYVVVQATSAGKLPDSVSFDAASASLTNLMTAVGALTLSMGLARPPPTGIANPTGKTLLVYGGSSVLGRQTTELARRAGYTVVTTSSPANMAETRRFAGAGAVVDHTQAADAVAAQLAALGPFDFAFDAITTAASKPVLAGVLRRQGGGVYWSVMPAGPEPDADLPAGVERRGASYPAVVEADEETNRWFFDELLPAGLASGDVTVPKILKLPGGLKSAQDALDRMAKNETGGAKLVVDPWET